MKTGMWTPPERKWTPTRRTIARTARLTLLVMITVTSAACVLHYLMPHAHPPAASEFGMGPRRSAGGAYMASLVTDESLRARKLQTVRLQVADSVGHPIEGASIAVDGGMPAHGHGLPTRPRVTRSLGDGAYLVEGLRFNMGGWWVLTFHVDALAGADSVTFNLDI